MSTLRAGLNKVILQSITPEKSEFKISLPDHLKEKKYKILNIGNQRTSFDNVPPFSIDDIVHLAPSTGFIIKENGNEYVVCSYDDILAVV